MIVFCIVVLHSCRQDDDNDVISEIAQNRIIQENSPETVNKITLTPSKTENLEDGDPPVKNGTHWRVEK